LNQRAYQTGIPSTATSNYNDLKNPSKQQLTKRDSELSMGEKSNFKNNLSVAAGISTNNGSTHIDEK